MAHQHSVYDVDTHFKIDAVTRQITSEAGAKTTIMQYDHNSERFTFELPRYIEGHDMKLCTKVEVHYINVARDKTTHSDVYEVQDFQLSPVSEDIVIGSWLISQNATGLAGLLSFALRFTCLTDGQLGYVWSTAVYDKITVSDGIYNSEIVVEQYADVLEQWKQELIDAGGGGSGGSVPTKLSELKNDVGFVTANDISAIATFSDYENFYSGIAGNYVDTSKWLDGQIIRIEDSAVPTLYVKKRRSPGSSLPNTEEAFIAELDSNGYAGDSELTFRKYSEVIGCDPGDIDAALDGILTLERSFLEGGAV